MAAQNDVVHDKAQSKLSDLWTKEDYWAIWLGLLIAFFGAWLLFFSHAGDFKAKNEPKFTEYNQIIEKESQKPFRTIAYYNAVNAKGKIKLSSDLGKTVGDIMGRPKRWSGSPLSSFFMGKEEADAKNAANKAKAETAKVKTAELLETAKAAESAAADAEFKDATLNKEAEKAIDAWRKAPKAPSTAKAYNVFPSLFGFMVIAGLLFSIGILFMGQNVPKFLLGFIFMYWLAVIAFFLGNEATMRKYGLGSEAWAIILGMLIANTVGTPNFVKPALQTEFYIKTGLVLLGAEVLFDKIVAIGIPGVFVAWVVTPIVLVTTYIFGQKVLKMPSKTLNIVISADMSVCGTSAAIATAAASRAKKEELTLAIGISLAFTAVMMVVMPLFIRAVGMHPVLGGAWIGGTIDATGAVAAAGAVLGDKAMYVAATIKMIQNVLIGVTAFCVAVYWCAKVDCVEGQKVSAMEIWHRFPKFVLGFLFVSIVFSYISGSYGADMSKAVVSEAVIKGLTSPLRGWFFGFAFASIGLATNFRELKHYFAGGKPVILYVCGQSFNLCLTLLMAWIMFFKVFPDITAKI
ncbi:MAG: hypothetical protein DELT_01581 [Desulfovibrio sp.]